MERKIKLTKSKSLPMILLRTIEKQMGDSYAIGPFNNAEKIKSMNKFTKISPLEFITGIYFIYIHTLCPKPH